MSNPKKAQHARVAIGPDVISVQTLIDRAGVVGTLAILTALYNGNPAFKAVIDDYVAAGVALAAAQTKVSNLEAQLADARGARDQQHLLTEDSHGAAAKQVERYSKTAADVQKYGFVHIDVVKLGLVPPTAIVAAYNHTTHLLGIHVKYPKGTRALRCILEISTDPVGPTTYHRIDGDGRRRSLSGYAPGTYWIRAATSVSGGRSDWFGPVAVIVT